MINKSSKFIIAILLVMFGVAAAYASGFANETLNYGVSYKWGLVHKEAATARITLRQTPEYYDVIVTAATKPWADKLFQVRDTLKSRISKSSFRPVSYTKITHEGKKYRRDALTYSYMNNHAYGKCVRYKAIESKPGETTIKTCNSTGPTFDMVSIFYYIRNLDYNRLSAQKVAKATIFSGSAPETITIRNLGKEKLTLGNGKIIETQHLQFTFTSQAGKKTSLPMDAWVTTDSQRTPVKLTGQLSFGKVVCTLK